MIYRYTKFSNSYLKHMDQSYRQQTHNNFYNSLIEIYDKPTGSLLNIKVNRCPHPAGKAEKVEASKFPPR